jgi:hypothetical protein
MVGVACRLLSVDLIALPITERDHPFAQLVLAKKALNAGSCRASNV